MPEVRQEYQRGFLQTNTIQSCASQTREDSGCMKGKANQNASPVTFLQPPVTSLRLESYCLPVRSVSLSRVSDNTGKQLSSVLKLPPASPLHTCKPRASLQRRNRQSLKHAIRPQHQEAAKRILLARLTNAQARRYHCILWLQAHSNVARTFRDPSSSNDSDHVGCRTCRVSAVPSSSLKKAREHKRDWAFCFPCDSALAGHGGQGVALNPLGSFRDRAHPYDICVIHAHELKREQQALYMERPEFLDGVADRREAVLHF